MNTPEEALRSSRSFPAGNPTSDGHEAPSDDVGAQELAKSGQCPTALDCAAAMEAMRAENQALRATLIAAVDQHHRLTAVLHVNGAHPDFQYVMTYGAPVGAHMGTGWEPNPEGSSHGVTLRNGAVCSEWRRRKDRD